MSQNSGRLATNVWECVCSNSASSENRGGSSPRQSCLLCLRSKDTVCNCATVTEKARLLNLSQRKTICEIESSSLVQQSRISALGQALQYPHPTHASMVNPAGNERLSVWLHASTAQNNQNRTYLLPACFILYYTWGWDTCCEELVWWFSICLLGNPPFQISSAYWLHQRIPDTFLWGIWWTVAYHLWGGQHIWEAICIAEPQKSTRWPFPSLVTGNQFCTSSWWTWQGLLVYGSHIIL